ncbi:MAG TPA: hypothetical protein VLV83_13385 [Acidobacteriota bacterium]|nr:hypothetical protein [Acidobacteriota bacterium]
MWKGIIRVLFWTYERGTLQYDLMVLAILAFIFLTPLSVFDGSFFRQSSDAGGEIQIEEEAPAPHSARPEPSGESASKPSEDELEPERTR